MDTEQLNQRLKEEQRRTIDAMCMATGWPPTTLAKNAGLAPSTVNRFMTGKTKHALSALTMRQLQEASGQHTQVLDRDRMEDAIAGTITYILNNHEDPEPGAVAKRCLYQYDELQEVGHADIDKAIEKAQALWRTVESAISDSN